jgi:GNAT superfamily N-acetyltransferase
MITGSAGRRVGGPWQAGRVSLPTDVVVRQRRAEDLDACAALLHRVHELDRYPVRWPADPVAFLTPASELVTWVAHCGATLAGHVMLAAAADELGEGVPTDGDHLPVEDLVLLRLLFVSPEARGRRLGAHLLDVATAEATARGRRTVLEVLSLNLDAIAVYERVGWTAIGTTTPDWAPDGTHAVVYLAPR